MAPPRTLGARPHSLAEARGHQGLARAEENLGQDLEARVLDAPHARVRDGALDSSVHERTAGLPCRAPLPREDLEEAEGEVDKHEVDDDVERLRYRIN